MSKVIKVNNLSKVYDLGLVGTGTLFKDLNRTWAKIRRKPDPYATLVELNDRTQKGSSNIVYALKDINFSIGQGEVLGIIGKNGAGKSTLLKILSQITSPSTGTVKMKGRVASLLEVGTGMHPEMTARQNVFLNGSLMGMRRNEIKSKLEEIIDFAGILKYIDTPIKRFSSGMQVRLGFAIAAFLEPEVLIVDEVLAVGDAEFQKKAIGKMQDVSKGEGRTVLFVSHNMASVQSLCSRAVLMDSGATVYEGNVSEAINRYLDIESKPKFFLRKTPDESIDVSFQKIKVLNHDNQLCSEFTCEENILISFDLKINIKKNPYSLFVIIKNKNGSPVFSAEIKITKPKHLLTIQKNFLVRGNYFLHSFIHIANIEQIDVVEGVCPFNITDSASSFAIHGGYDYGNVFGKYTWK